MIALLSGLRELGWLDGQNISVEYRSAEFRDERLPALATELVGLDMDVIVATTTPGAPAAKQVTSTVPIVMPTMLDPVGSGLVASLARPGANVTGLSFLGPVHSGKRLQLLKEAIPSVASVVVLWVPGNPGSASDFAQTSAAAGALGLQLGSQELRSQDDFEGAFAAISSQPPDALVVLPAESSSSSSPRMWSFPSPTDWPKQSAARQPPLAKLASPRPLAWTEPFVSSTLTLRAIARWRPCDLSEMVVGIT